MSADSSITPDLREPSGQDSKALDSIDTSAFTNTVLNNTISTTLDSGALVENLELKSRESTSPQQTPDPMTPSLQISREQTPDDSDLDTASNFSADDSNLSENDFSLKRGGSHLVPGLAKRVKIGPTATQEDSDIDTQNSAASENPNSIINTENQHPAGLQKESYLRRVSAKLIEKLWTVLSFDAFKLFEKLCTISLTKVLERFAGGPNADQKIAETQRVLWERWFSEDDPRSFLARLKMTKLPPVKSLNARARGMKDDEFDPLNIDQVLHKKAICETYLLAELAQLEDLEKYYQNLKATHEQDAKYLSEFTKTARNLGAQVAQEKVERSQELHLDEVPEIVEDINLHTLRKLSLFNPNEDEETRNLLLELDAHLKVPENMDLLLQLCDELDKYEQ